MNILFSESIIGFHSKIDTHCEIIPLSFIPQIKEKENGGLYPFVNIDKIKRVEQLINDYKSGIKITFLIGFDLDENGEFMAQALRNYLISKSVRKDDIIRTPLTEDGYLSVNKFLDIADYIKFRKLQKDFSLMLKENKVGDINIIELLSLKYLDKKKGKYIELESLKNSINLEGTSTVTFITNNLLHEEE